MSRRNNERGGIVVFAVVGVLLVGFLAGALYLGKQGGETAKQNKPAPIAIDTEKEATKDAESSTRTPKEEAESKPATPAPAPEKPEPQQQTPAPATPSTSTAPSRVATVPNSGPSQVAATGPSDSLLSAAVVVAVSFVSLVFIQSTTRLRRSALNR
jgi:flagellum-specific peptidoglycan hydrolase FlgJ